MSHGQILVVEDEPRLRFVVCRQLVEAGYDVLPVEDGEAAWNTLQRVTPDLILLNIQLPDADGVELCGRIRADARLSHVPVIIFTARTDSDSRARCFAAGANDYVTKPWEAADLARRIADSITRARSDR